MGKLKVCEKFYCDYIPCVEERIAQLDAEGFDAGKLREWLVKLNLYKDQEAIWLAEHNEGLDSQNARV